MGTMLQSQGLKPGQQPELLNITQPELIRDIHRQYIAAGCDIIKTNTFGANPIKLAKSDVEKVVCAGVTLARDAAGKKQVALDIGPTGKLLYPLGELTFEDAVNCFAPMVKAGVKSGADIILIETMNDTYELKAAVIAAKENSNLPVYATVTFDENGKLLTGADVVSVIALLEGLRVDAIGVNCGSGPSQMQKLISTFREYSSLPLIINPNAGLPKVKDGETYFDIAPEEFAEQMKQLALLGGNILGGCCGTTPSHIKALIKKTQAINPHAPQYKSKTLVSSYGGFVEIGESPTIIGERINPTGKKLLKQALREDDFDFIVEEGLNQKDCGAHILDVNVGLPEINEEGTMLKAITALQQVVRLPLQIDSANPLVIEKALRLYNGKAMVNSVNGKQESMDAIFPIVKKYGGVVVALTLDEQGIPAKAEQRLKIAEKIIKNAKKHGIDKKDIIVDPLTMAISSGEDEALTTLNALTLIKNKAGVKTVLGVSNVSFGLPARDVITSSFFLMALQNGLNAAIINPCSQSVMNVYYAFNALFGNDKNCTKYIASQIQMENGSNISDPTLVEIIIKGLSDESYEAAKKLLLSTAPLDIINNHLIPALDKVGNDYETGKLFLPQLLMSAKTAKSAFDAIKEHLKKTNSDNGKKDTIIIATVEGDVHDIGKNIVKVLLENYGFNVIDLGKDIKAAKIIDAVKKHNAHLLALSALMTTTVANVEKTIKLLRIEAPDCSVMVGGAVLTEEYAKMIGADYYSKDATGAATIAKRFFENMA
ncbi:MAG: homocysteine S-methyltransferase family protein [Firmicutes bacterium]|nr:homocysteine S-methyltransferase family protein [Bacillota bacterium]